MQPLPQPLPLNKVISDNKIFYGRNEKTINELIGSDSTNRKEISFRIN